MPLRLPLLLAVAFGLFAATLNAAGGDAAKPNILFIISEDNGPHIGAYGDAFADTPNIDALAAKGVRYLNAWSTAPVCAPARTTLASGLYPPSTGAEHMRSITSLPEGFRMYPQILRDNGYFTVNIRKEDFNLQKTGKLFDGGRVEDLWEKRPGEQPWYMAFNIGTSHESQIRKRPHQQVHDPAKVRVPAYHPDTPEVRRDWAQYYDKMTEMDAQVGQLVKRLDDRGLLENTIVFYFGDHGSGMPRSKRWPYNSGLRVPLVIVVPEHLRHLAPEGYEPGEATDRLVGFIDFGPTALSLAGVEPPQYYQGHAFMGEHAAPEQNYIFGFRGRMDERYDMVRVARDKRYLYIRNYMPHKIYGQYIDYMFQTPTTRKWHDMYHAGELDEAQSIFWETKQPEELYDLQADPDEVNNLAHSPEHRHILERLRLAQRAKAIEIRDVGFLPEYEIHRRAEDSTPYAVGHAPEAYPLERIMATAELASMLEPEAIPALKASLGDPDPAVRYWAAMGFLMRGEEGVSRGREALSQALEDESPVVRVTAAEALARHGGESDLGAALDTLVDHANIREDGVFLAMLSLNALDKLGTKAASRAGVFMELPDQAPGVPGRMRSYVNRLLDRINSKLAAE